MGLVCAGYALIQLARPVPRPGSVADPDVCPTEAAGVIRCEYCHADVPADRYPSHAAEHAELLADGQQREYASLPLEDRYGGDLDGVPRVYVHVGCGGRTVMQEKIIRSYLADPFLYDDGVFCTGCGRHAPDRRFVWAETGENLRAYMDGLRRAALSRRWGRLGWVVFWVRKLVP